MDIMDYRRFYDFGKAVGKVSLPLLFFSAQNPKSLFPSLRILRQLRLRHLWGSRAWWNSLERPHRRHPPRIIPHAKVQSLPFPHLRRPASPPCPTSRSLIVSTMSRPPNPKQSCPMRQSLNPKQSRPTMRSILTTGASKWCAARLSFASTPARCHSTLPYSVECFHRRISPLSSLQTGAHALYSPIHQPISRPF